MLALEAIMKNPGSNPKHQDKKNSPVHERKATPLTEEQKRQQKAKQEKNSPSKISIENWKYH